MPPVSPSPSSTDSSAPLADGWLAAFFSIDLSQAVQILFWLVAGTIAVLTYWHARRTVFQPLRVEVFKLQLAVLTRVSEDFVSRDEMALRDYFDLANCVDFNASLMFEAFAEQEFSLKRKKSLLDEHGAAFPRAIVSSDALFGEDFKLVAPPAEEGERAAQLDVPEQGRLDWNDYRHHVVSVSRGFHEAEERVRALARDPLVPAELGALLSELADTAQANLIAIRPALTEAAKQMKVSYPTSESIEGASSKWVSNVWNRKIQPLEPIADKIGAYVRSFVESERTGFGRLNPRS